MQLNQLFERIPRRHSADNVKEIYTIIDTYEDMLRAIDMEPAYEQDIATFFDELAPIRAIVKSQLIARQAKKQKTSFLMKHRVT